MFWEPSTDYEFGPFRIDASERQLLRNGQVVPLTQKAFDVLFTLVQNSGHIFTKDEVMKIVWPGTAVEEGNLARNISTLRSALGERPRDSQFIETIPWRGYRFVAPVRKIREQQPVPPLDSIAVLPFENVGGDARTEYLSDGVSESLTTLLAQLTNLRITSRNSAFRYKARDIDTITIGRELGVQAILMGRLQETEGMFSISVELVSAADDRHIWGAQYIRSQEDLLAAQETIAREIAGKLRVEIAGRAQPQPPAQAHSDDHEAYLLFLKGRFHFNKLTLDGVEKGAEYFQEAIELDPNYALAYAGLADCRNYVGKREEAKQAIEKALALDDCLGEAHASYGFFRFLYEWDFAGAEASFVKAVALSPNYAEAHHWYAIYLANVGRHEEAFREAELAVERDPLSLLMNMTAALNFYTGREYDRAIAQLKKVIEMDHHFPAARSVLGCVYVQMGRFAVALSQYDKKNEALTLLAEIDEQPASPYSLGGVYGALGETDKAFEMLNKAYLERDMQLVSLKVDPALDDLRADSRFGQLVRRVGFPPSPASRTRSGNVQTPPITQSRL